MDGQDGGGGERSFVRARGRRPVTDYGSTVSHWLRNREARYQGAYYSEAERPSASYMVDMLPPSARVASPADTIPTRHLHSSLNKIKHPINVVRWTPEGRRLLTASSSGEFTLWNGTGFNFETIMQAHDVAIRALAYSHSDDWLISADHDGTIKYWQPNFNNVQVLQGHTDPIRDLAFAPNDSKFVTASDDSTLKIFDFAGGVAESTLSGHGWDAKSCDWHPRKGLLVSGSKDHLVKLWDPRTGRCLTTLHGHKNTITKTLFEKAQGDCLATSARDQTARIFDLRWMRDVLLLKGHEKDISTLTWHPIHPNLLSTGGADGALFHYLLDEPHTPPGQTTNPAPFETNDPQSAPPQTIYPAHKVPYAHEYAIWSLDWHPLGHLLASGSNDRITRFWSRSRPGDFSEFTDRYHIGEAAAEAQGTWDRRSNRRQRQEEEEQEEDDEADGLVDQKMPVGGPPGSALPGIPGLPGLSSSNGSAALPIPPPQIPGMNLPSGSAPPPLPFPLLGMNGAPPPPPPIPGADGQTPPDLAALAEMMQKAGIPFPPPPGLLPPGAVPPPGGIANLPPGFVPPPGFPVPPPPGADGPIPMPPMMQQQQSNDGSVSSDASPGKSSSLRRRAPLPSQEESLRLEQSRGKFTRSR
ncbi:protein PFS2 [Zalerion maritima]|uniref:Polyadenylation factor subunit 2 n=1 Tax=Zalerion maritima TaxID=339359 RepID=A0AAD5RY84_9PEZI|nr:protein PFS2 [Zalerion maritima]